MATESTTLGDERIHLETVAAPADEERRPTGAAQLAARLAATIQTVRRERADAAAAVRALLALPHAARREAVREDPRFRTVEVVAHLLERGAAFLIEDPFEAEALARLALHVTDHALLAGGGEPAAGATRAWAWTLVAEARCMRGERATADMAYSKAGQALRAGVDLHLEVVLRRLLGCLRREDHGLGAALPLLLQTADLLLADGAPPPDARRAERA